MKIKLLPSKCFRILQTEQGGVGIFKLFRVYFFLFNIFCRTMKHLRSLRAQMDCSIKMFSSLLPQKPLSLLFWDVCSWENGSNWSVWSYVIIKIFETPSTMEVSLWTQPKILSTIKFWWDWNFIFFEIYKSLLGKK